MISKEKQELLRLYNEGLNFYKLRRWDDAIRSFEKALVVDSADGPSELYLKRSREYKISPPGDDWDGVFVMTTK
jgi:hypothetical protein